MSRLNPDDPSVPAHLRAKIKEALAKQRGEGAAKVNGTPTIAVHIAAPKPRKKKFSNKPCEIAGERFDSKLEARAFEHVKVGTVAVLRQVTIPLGTNPETGRAVSIRPDFLRVLEVYPDGTFRAELVDAKGAETRDWTNKAAWLHGLCGVRIRRLRKADLGG